MFGFDLAVEELCWDVGRESDVHVNLLKRLIPFEHLLPWNKQKNHTKNLGKNKKEEPKIREKGEHKGESREEKGIELDLHGRNCVASLVRVSLPFFI